MIGFIQDEDRLREARKQAKQTRDKYVGYSSEEASSRYSKLSLFSSNRAPEIHLPPPSLSPSPQVTAMLQSPGLDPQNPLAGHPHTTMKIHEGPLVSTMTTWRQKRTATRTMLVMNIEQPHRGKPPVVHSIIITCITSGASPELSGAHCTLLVVRCVGCGQ